MPLTEQNFLLFAATSYTNHSCVSTDEFLEDLKRIKYLKKLFYNYKKKGVFRERLILNHLIVLYNVFEARACTRMLFFKLEEYLDALLPFLILTGYLPELVENIGSDGKTFITSQIMMDQFVISKVREVIKMAEAE